MNRLVQEAGDSGILSHLDDCQGVLWEAGAAVAEARVEKFSTDATIGTHAFADLADIRTVMLAEAGHLIDEGDLGSQHRVR